MRSSHSRPWPLAVRSLPADLLSQVNRESDASTTVASTIRSFEGTRDLITSIENKWGATSVSKFEYTNDALGRRTSVTVSGTAFTAAGTTGFDLYSYNDRNELTSARRYAGGTISNPSDPVYARHFEYAYDPIGNRETYEVSQGTATTYTANELNQYTATENPSESFTHDDDGNLTQDGTYTYVWDAENRLIEVYPTNPTTGSQKCVMTYDYMNRRVQRSLYNWTGSAWAGTYSSSRIFIYDGWNNLIAYNPAGGLNVFRKNTWGLDLSGLNGNAGPGALHAAGGIAGLIGSTVANALPPPSYLCFYDANGNLSETAKNTDGTLWGHYEYDPWGKQLIKYETGGIAHPFRYSTKYSDGLFEKYYYGQRYLDLRLGRWSSRDPIGILGGNNSYAFVSNTPIVQLDAVGLRPEQWLEYTDNYQWGMVVTLSDGSQCIFLLRELVTYRREVYAIIYDKCSVVYGVAGLLLWSVAPPVSLALGAASLLCTAAVEYAENIEVSRTWVVVGCIPTVSSLPPWEPPGPFPEIPAECEDLWWNCANIPPLPDPRDPYCYHLCMEREKALGHPVDADSIKRCSAYCGRDTIGPR